MRARILSMGEALVDILPAEPGRWRPVAGGSSYNVAVALGRLGATAAFVGRLSSDEQGEAMYQALLRDGVDTDLISRDERPSPLSLVSRGSETTSARYSIYLEGTAHAPPHLTGDWMAQAAHLHVSSFSAIAGEWGATVGAALENAAGRVSTSFDINIRPALIPSRAKSLAIIESRVAHANIVKASEEDLDWLFPNRPPAQAATDWASRSSCLVLLTQGAAGATAFWRDTSLHRPARAIVVADTVGAGDAFIAAFLACVQEAGGLAKTNAFDPKTLAGWLDFANQAAALCCARHGANPATREEIDAFGPSS